jgi:hypothetical protein
VRALRADRPLAAFLGSCLPGRHAGGNRGLHLPRDTPRDRQAAPPSPPTTQACLRAVFSPRSAGGSSARRWPSLPSHPVPPASRVASVPDVRRCRRSVDRAGRLADPATQTARIRWHWTSTSPR